MKHWRMRTTLIVSLLAVSLGLTATCLLIIRVSVQQQIRRGLAADLDHSVSTFRNIAHQRGEMLSREAALLADLPSLKAIMVTHDAHTIADGSEEFWTTSGSDFFALTSETGALFTYSNRGLSLDRASVIAGLRACMNEGTEGPCMIAFGRGLYEISIQPLYFGRPSDGYRLGYVVIGYQVDRQVATEVSEAAAADVTFLVDGDISATTVREDRWADLRLQSKGMDIENSRPRKVRIGSEEYMAAAYVLRSEGQGKVELVVLKSYDRASQYLKSVNRWVVALGISALLIGSLLAAAIARTITRPLEALVAGTRALGQGDFNYRLSTDGAVEVRELGVAFERMRRELKRTQAEVIESERLATIGAMASSVSHDLRHHLAAIYANAEFMSLSKTGAAERTELLLEVKEAVQGMTDLIESLLLFSQTNQTLHLRYEAIGPLVERTIHLLRQHPECRDVEITTNLWQVDAWVDSTKLGRALYNLLLNGCQAAKKGEGPALVTVALTEHQQTVKLSICDTGTGVPDCIRRTLFQPFISAGKENGVGLGLTLAQHIAQEHGGEVKLEESAPGRTVFSLVLNRQAPQVCGSDQSMAAATSSNQEESGTMDAREVEPRYEQL